MSNIAAIWPLTPLQEGLLFHSLYDPDAPETHPVQWVLSVRRELDRATLRRATRDLLARHANLRAGFRARDRGAPVQVIVDDLEVPVELVDLSDRRQPDHELERILATEHRRKFDVGQPPLIRLTVVKLASEDYRVVLTTHHILLDGWSMPILFHELISLYLQVDLPPAVPYERFVAWMAGRNTAESLATWRSVLSGAKPCLLAPSGTQPQRNRQYLAETLPEQQTEQLIRLARTHQLTLNTVVQGMWGLMLGRHLGRDDVLFGAVVAGRPPDLTGAETMIGMFTNTVPVRLKWTDADRGLDVLARLQQQQADTASHQQVRLVDLQRLVGNTALFDTVLTFQNYPIDKHDDLPEFSFVGARGGNPYTLALMAIPGDRLELRLSYRPDRLTTNEAQVLLRQLRQLLTDFLANPLAPVEGPRAPEAKLLRELFAQVLGLQQVGMHDSFFELGGDSIVLLQLTACARRAGLRLTPRDVFERPTVAKLTPILLGGHGMSTREAPDRSGGRPG